ncbi:MAG: hypothetical protein LBB45_01645 [Methanobrevibacter sp.]|nr:hypothetical protein [Candidatus Methanovirga basalitermitum]
MDRKIILIIALVIGIVIIGLIAIQPVQSKNDLNITKFEVEDSNKELSSLFSGSSSSGSAIFRMELDYNKNFSSSFNITYQCYDENDTVFVTGYISSIVGGIKTDRHYRVTTNSNANYGVLRKVVLQLGDKDFYTWNKNAN